MQPNLTMLAAALSTGRRMPLAQRPGSRAPSCRGPADDPRRARPVLHHGAGADAGCDDKAIAAAVRGGSWHRIRRGYFTLGPQWREAAAEEQHRIRSAAVMHSLGDKVALSHVSAVVHHGIAVWDLPLGRVHVTRLDGGPGRIESDVVHHEGLSFGDDVVHQDGLWVTRPVRAVLEAGSRATGAAKLVPLDALLHQDPDAPLRAQFELMRHWPFMRSMHVPVRMADGRAESPGETVGRWLFRAAGLPAPQLQYEVFDDAGTSLGFTDYAWPEHRLLGEFDGRVKYGRLLKSGQQAGDVVFAEKQREDAMRAAINGAMVRFVWADWSRPRLAAERVRNRLTAAG